MLTQLKIALDEALKEKDYEGALKYAYALDFYLKTEYVEVVQGLEKEEKKKVK